MMNLFASSYHNKLLSNSNGSILPLYSTTYNVKGANIYCSFDSLETYKLFFYSVAFKIIKNSKVEADFTPLSMIVPDTWPKIKPLVPDDCINENVIFPAPAFDFGICGHILFKKPIENPTRLQVISNEPFVKKMNEIAHNRMFHRMTGIEKSAKITIKFFGEKMRVAL
jgi:hypothetical protein